MLNRQADQWTERKFQDTEVIVSELLPGFVVTVADRWVYLNEEFSDL